MKLPTKEVYVLGKTFKFKLKKFSDEQYGEMRYGAQEILIEPRQIEESAKDSAMHEIVHAIDRTLGLKLKERQVHALGAALVQVMWDNPKLMKWILK